MSLWENLRIGLAARTSSPSEGIQKLSTLLEDEFSQDNAELLLHG